MCLAIPAQITEIDGARGKVTLAGNVRDADFSLIDEPALGDWVLVHAGFAIEKLEPEDARETLALFSELQEGMGDFGLP
ncbi:MAG TPA: HypC/HybG/HupF family hydrogenase formation chaperone [Candidatus Hydrogenedentes bacterium]|jgi:hydrogenase expression/formation protein HypC|nr:HypC/HybG/HupF family hydrogenase formation chaperone [Candidatus Hydrogenedentota bacterium]HPJ99242.1 HypC/HybG/HupF family hydrogenase formation chaperone [Candidatus Hydrogenedentota bacterium]